MLVRLWVDLFVIVFSCNILVRRKIQHPNMMDPKFSPQNFSNVLPQCILNAFRCMFAP